MILFTIPANFYIDLGGTPAIILSKNPYRTALTNGLNEDQFIAILDPFDLSRNERKLELGDYKTKALKFSIEVPDEKVDLNSEEVNPPKPGEIKILLNQIEGQILEKIKIKEKYYYLEEQIIQLSKNSKNLREFMNGLINILLPNLKLIKLEEVLSKNTQTIYKILKKIDIPVRAICPFCKQFTMFSLKPEFSNCSKCNSKIYSQEMIKSGKYIPQQGFFAVITFLCGYKTFSNSEEKANQAEEIMKKLNLKEPILIGYKESENKLTMFEDYLLKETLINPKNLIKLSKEDK